MPIIAVILGSIAFAVGGQVSLKGGMNRVGRIGRAGGHRWRDGWMHILMGLASYGASMLLWLYTLSRVELSYAFPFVSLSFVGIVLVARFGLGEQIHPTRILGSLLIVAGVLVVSWS